MIFCMRLTDCIVTRMTDSVLAIRSSNSHNGRSAQRYDGVSGVLQDLGPLIQQRLAQFNQILLGTTHPIDYMPWFVQGLVYGAVPC